MNLTKWMCLVAACMIAVPAFGKRKIPLHGEWITKGKTVILDLPIEGSLEETTGELTLAFTENLGDVVVTVLDESVQNGTVSITDGMNLVYGEIY